MEKEDKLIIEDDKGLGIGVKISFEDLKNIFSQIKTNLLDIDAIIISKEFFYKIN